MGPLYDVGDAAAGLTVYPGHVCDSETQRLWVIVFLCAKPDNLMSVGPLSRTGQNKIFF